MNAHSSMLHIRLDDDLKARANMALEAMGLTASDAVRLLYHRIATDQAFPLELKVPNAATRLAIEEARAMIAEGRASHKSAGALDEALPIARNAKK